MDSIKAVKCLVPFTQLSVNVNGYCYSCASSWTTLGNSGRLKGKSIMDIWNGERMQYIRKAILENKLDKVCNFKYCPYAIENKDINVEWGWGDDHYKAIIEQIHKGKTKLETAPYELIVAGSGQCNLRCVMCRSHDGFIPDQDKFDEHLYSKLLPEILPLVSRILLTGNGDPIFNKHSRNFLQNLDAEKYPSLKIKLQTNANLLTPHIWDTIKHNNYESIHVSIDAATKETYEKVRKNGKWDLLMKNLKLISELRHQGVFSKFSISFVILKSNYKEIKSFAELGKELGCDMILFQKDYTVVNIIENINLTNHKRIKIEIAQILKDPIFSEPQVNTLLIDEYRQYSSLKSNIIDRTFTKLKGAILQYPILSMFSLIKQFPFLIDASEYYKIKIGPLLNQNKPYKKDMIIK